MHVHTRRNGMALILFVVGFTMIVTLALASTTWAAPNAQGTVPTPPKPTAQATASTGGGGTNNGGGQKNGGGKSGGSDNGGSQVNPTAAPGAGSVCAIGENGAQCTADSLTIVVGAGVVPAGSALTIEGPFAQPPCPASPDGAVFLNRCYRFGWIGTNAQPLSAISGPVQYCVTYGAEQLGATDNKPDSMLFGFAGGEEKWTLVKPTIDTNANRVCATTNQEIMWGALFAPKAASTLLPTVGGEWNLFWMAPLAVVGVAMMLGAWRIARKGAE
jgi:hypothetical protein